MKSTFRDLAGSFSVPFAIFAGLGAEAASAAGLSVDFQWAPENHQCQKVSPQLNLSGMLSGTTEFKTKLVDKNNRGYNHGGGTVDYSGGGVIPEGAIKSAIYRAPCPKGNNKYEITARALDASGTTLATASAIQACCSGSKKAKSEQSAVLEVSASTDR